MTNSFGLGANTWWPPEQAAAEQFYEYSDRYNSEDTLAQFDRVTGAAKSYFGRHRAGEVLRDDIIRKADNGEPGSYIRMGDADGNVLFPFEHPFPELTSYCLRKISRIYFGNDDLMEENVEFFRDIVIKAVEGADVIGAPDREVVKHSYSRPAEQLDVRGMCGMRGVYNYFGADYDLSRIAQAHWSSTWISRALLPHFLDILRGRRFVGFITCYEDLAPLMEDWAGIDEVETLLVPMQASIAYHTTKETSRLRTDIRHYPEAYPHIMEAIRPRYAGCIYIVAAGILSKAYCTQIKARGGIAIDVGSVADLWMSVRSRPKWMRNELLEEFALGALAK